MKNAANNPPKDIEGNLIQLFEKADKSKFRFDEVISGGSYSYQKSGEKTEVEGLISDGIAEFKANPGKYVAISYQTSMADWPEDQQKYTLYMRKGWQGLKPKEADDGWQTWIVSSYECLPKIDLGGAANRPARAGPLAQGAQLRAEQSRVRADHRLAERRRKVRAKVRRLRDPRVYEDDVRG